MLRKVAVDTIEPAAIVCELFVLYGEAIIHAYSPVAAKAHRIVVHRSALRRAAQVVVGHPVFVVTGGEFNRKLTLIRRIGVARAEQIAVDREDVHRKRGRACVLGVVAREIDAKFMGALRKTVAEIEALTFVFRRSDLAFWEFEVVAALLHHETAEDVRIIRQ